jgi:hypothetical protein
VPDLDQAVGELQDVQVRHGVGLSLIPRWPKVSSLSSFYRS